VISVAAVATLLLILRGHAWAPRVATVAGLVSAVAVSAAHLAPPWGVLSNSYLALRPGAFAWVVVGIEIVGGLMTGFAGLTVWREGLVDPAAPGRVAV
jgi:hypothetical protein